MELPNNFLEISYTGLQQSPWYCLQETEKYIFLEIDTDIFEICYRPITFGTITQNLYTLWQDWSTRKVHLWCHVKYILLRLNGAENQNLSTSFVLVRHEIHGSLPHSQELTTCHYPKPDKSSPYVNILIHSIIINEKDWIAKLFVKGDILLSQCDI